MNIDEAIEYLQEFKKQSGEEVNVSISDSTFFGFYKQNQKEMWENLRKIAEEES